MKNIDKQYIVEKARAQSPEDLMGKLLFNLLHLQNANNQGLNGLNDRQNSRHKDMLQKQDEIENILSQIKEVILKKDVDLSEVVDVLNNINSSVKKGSSKMVDKMDMLPFEIPETKKILLETLKAIRANKPAEVVFDKLINSQDEGMLRLGKLISILTGEVKKKEFPKEISISGPVDVQKPKWWKEFSLSWEPLKKMLDGLKSHTFSVKVENQSKFDDSIFKNLPEEISMKLAKVLEESLPKIRIRSGGGMGNPFSFSNDGKLITTNSDSVFNNILDGRKTVTTAGTAVKLAADTPVSRVIITAMINNTDYVVVGGSTVVAAESTRRGIPLVAGQSIEMNISNLNLIYLDAVVSGEGVTFIYF